MAARGSIAFTIKYTEPPRVINPRADPKLILTFFIKCARPTKDNIIVSTTTNDTTISAKDRWAIFSIALTII